MHVSARSPLNTPLTIGGSEAGLVWSRHKLTPLRFLITCPPHPSEPATPIHPTLRPFGKARTARPGGRRRAVAGREPVGAHLRGAVHQQRLASGEGGWEERRCERTVRPRGTEGNREGNRGEGSTGGVQSGRSGLYRRVSEEQRWKGGPKTSSPWSGRFGCRAGILEFGLCLLGRLILEKQIL